MASTTPPSPTKDKPSLLEAETREKELLTHPSDELEAEKNEQELSISPLGDIQTQPDQFPEPAPDAPPAIQEQEWVSGFKLFTILTAITLPCLLMLLDTSIVVTVCIKGFWFHVC